MPIDTDTEPAPPAVTTRQGDLSTLDERTREEAIALRRQMGAEDIQRVGFFIWGSIRILAVYGKWSFIRAPKRP
jgi:hypothetical protein